MKQSAARHAQRAIRRDGSSVSLLLAIAILIAAVSAAGALADEPEANPLPSSSEVAEAIEVGPAGSIEQELTDPSAAEGVALQELGRTEALEVMTGVFPEQVEAPAGVYDELQEATLLGPNVAVVPSESEPEAVEEAAPEAEAGGAEEHPPSAPAQLAGAALIDSTVPLEVAGAQGVPAPVDLSLAHVGGQLEPKAPLVEIQIPEDLGEAIELPGAGIGISLANAPAERAATVTEKSVAFYPNVAADTDLAVSPTPSGVETLTQLRSPESPTTQSYQLSLPAGAQLVSTQAGGAEVRDGGEVLMTVEPPSALDANGEAVPAELEVAGDAVRVHVEPPPDAKLPILVDPLFQTYEWAAKGTTKGICRNSFKEEESYSCNNREEWGYEVLEYPWGGLSHLTPNNNWGPAQPGIYVHAEGQQRSGDHATVLYTVPRYFKETPAPTSYIKSLKLSDVTWQALGQYASPYLFMGIWDSTAPGWVSYFSHTGQVEHGINEPAHVYEFPNPTPDTHAKAAEVGIYDTEASAGSNATVYVGAATVELGDNEAPLEPLPTPQSKWVDQSAPPLEFSASDKGLGAYAINATAEEVHRAGQAPPSWKALNGCVGVGDSACPLTWKSSDAGHQALNYEPALLPNGIDYLALTAEDPVGNKSVSSWAEVRVDHQAPGLGLSGNLTEQATVGTKLSNYTLNYAAADGDEAAAAATTPIGTTGTGTGQMQRPMAVAVDQSGNVWMVDRENNRVEEFNPKGEFIRQFGSLGAGNGQLSDPRGIAISSAGNVWVSELGNKRLQEFSPTGTFIRTITNAGFVEPVAIATGPEETLWVSDLGAHKVFQFKENGTLVRSISKFTNPGSVTFTTPTGIGVDRSGNAYVAEQSTNQIVEVSPAGEYVQKFGAAGTGAGQFKAPNGVAIAGSGNVFVVDAENSRIEEFKPDGTFLRQFGSNGTATNQLSEPRGIAFAPGNEVLIADAANHRLARWTHADKNPQSGAAKVEVKMDGTAVTTSAPGCSTRNCQLSGSWTLNADSYPGGSHKVEVIATDGVGLTTTKTLNVETHGDDSAPQVALSGTMTEQATKGTTLPTYKLKAAATDPGSAEERKSGVASETIKFDGTSVDSSSPGCPAEGCSLTREWTLESSSKSAGTHKVEVIATDAAGHTTTKTLEIKLERDTTAPVLETGNEKLFTAPGGWLEQKSYSYIAAATDLGGYGVTSLQLKIDGTVVKSASGTCSEGGCEKFLMSSINMANYRGGAHQAELVATDGAGNVRKRTWTINVDPDGHVTLGEAEDTLEAVESTTAETPIAPPSELLEPEQIEGGDNPGLEQVGSDITSTGVPDTTTMTTDPAAGFTIESPEGETHITPNVSETASQTVIAEEVAGVSANVGKEADSVIRPEYNGVQTFQAIRSEASPTKYSWTIHLYEGQTLEAVSEDQAEVLYESGKRAFLITAESAHDAIGHEVPTSLEVSGNVLTLNVDFHTGTFVYPIVAGAGWQTSYLVPVVVEGPEDELEIKEREKREQEEAEAEESAPPPPASGVFTEAEAQEVLASKGLGPEVIPAPEPSSSGEASASSVPEKVVKPYKRCSKLGCGVWWVEERNPSYHYKKTEKGLATAYWQDGTQVHGESWRPWYYWPELEVHLCGAGFTSPLHVWAGEQKHLTAWLRSQIIATAFTYEGDVFNFENLMAMQIWVWPNGFQQRWNGHWEVTQQWIENEGKCVSPQEA